MIRQPVQARSNAPHADPSDPPDEYGDGGTTVVGERRREARQPAPGRVWVSAPTPDWRRRDNPYHKRQVAGHNLSRRGVSFRSDQPMMPGTFHRLELGLADPFDPAAEVRVSHCTPIGDGYLVGGQRF